MLPSLAVSIPVLRTHMADNRTAFRKLFFGLYIYAMKTHTYMHKYTHAI